MNNDTTKVKRMNDFLLHDYIGHTNKQQPFSPEISYDNYPEQEDDVGEQIVLKYRFRQLAEYNEVDPSIVHRPEDDVDYYEPKQHSEEEDDNLFEDTFTILRHDKMSAFEAKMIAISEDYQVILVIRLDQVTDFNTDCFIYPNQMCELMGFEVEPQFVASMEEPRLAYVICATKGEPMYGVVLERVSEDENLHFRYITTDEAQFRIPYDEVPYFFLNDRQIAQVRKDLLDGKVPNRPQPETEEEDTDESGEESEEVVGETQESDQ